MSVYPRFAPFIREYIYRERWNTLHPIQERAATEIFDSGDHVLIAAGTASGKTEAAFFPVLSILDAVFNNGMKTLVVYISPLKALINDQAKRLEHLLASGRDSHEGLIPVWRWHGDVDSGSKNRFTDDPSGILLITPESLEALLLRKNREVARIFSALLYVVIDEVHVFMGSDRGSQLICQLKRIERANTDCVVQHVRRIGLSATLGNYEGGRNWLSQGTSINTSLVEDDNNTGKELSLALDYHVHNLSGGMVTQRHKSTSFYHALYNQCRNKRAIIFTNSRLEAEECAASLGTLAKTQGEPDIFQIHHGSVSAMFRDEAEEQLKFGEGPQVICATATLELGIDIGDLDRIIQLGPPWSVSAFVQRLGRSGRRNGRAEMYFSITGAAVNAGSGKYPVNEPESIPWELIRAMAVIQLYLEEKWIEPPEEKKLPYSLLVHQTLAILASLGEHRAETLTGLILSFPPFREIPVKDFRTLIAWLTDSNIIGTTEEGTLILGIEGERIVNRYSFYPVFPGEETFRVVLEGREIGTVNFVPDPMSVLVVGGQRWIVKTIDGQKREIWVTETKDEGNERLWRGRGGKTHNRIVEKMKQILKESNELNNKYHFWNPREKYPYLSTAACEALKRGSGIAQILGITDYPLVYCENELNSDKEKTATSVLFFPWSGSAGMRTITAIFGNNANRKILRIVSMEDNELYFNITTKLTQDEFRSLLIEILRKAINSFDNNTENSELLGHKEIPYTDKYDYLLPPELLKKQYVANMLDKKAAEKLLGEL
ncbi:MAG: DEAD/DEAH box helicase [Treponema sp.]|nr:DEAD/DEAH box helicase [Treponema sp.]